jgi:hypothetical protein
MPIEDYNAAAFFGRYEIVERVIGQALDPYADQKLRRSQLLEGPAKRGKSWVICGIRDRLRHPPSSPTTPADEAAPPTPLRAAVCLFTNNDVKALDLHTLVAKVWLALNPYVPPLSLMHSVSPADPEATQTRKLRDFLFRSNSDVAQLIAITIRELEGTTPPVYLVVLADGLDEFGALEPFERTFLQDLFSSDRVRLVASRRSEVFTAGWKTRLIRRQTYNQSLDTFPSAAAEQQLNSLVPPHGYRRLSPLFTFYKWQNPGANSFFAERAVANERKQAAALIMRDDVRRCILELSRSARHLDPIAEKDFEHLNAVVKQFPNIGASDVSRHHLNPVLGGMGDLERNSWLARLQERGIVMVLTNGLCSVHEEFVALCQEWERWGGP